MGDSGKMGINTRLTHSGNDPRDFFGFVNPPVVHASTVSVSRCGVACCSKAEIHLRYARDTHFRCLDLGDRCA